jgi:DNA polymerase
MIYIDFETRSECDLKRAGAWKYSQHPTTEVLCLAWLDEIEEVDSLSFENLRHPLSFRLVGADTKIEAHNAGFEFAIWHNVMVPRYGWPTVPQDRWYCSAAKAAMHGLPRSLDGATAALGLSEVKDKAGHKLMLKLCKPRPTWKKKGTGDKYFGTSEEFEQLEAYCRQDVKAEYALSQALDNLSDKERKIWCLDQTINRRGVQADLPLVNKCIELAAVNEEKGKAAIAALTDGEVTSPNQVAKLREWINTKKLLVKTYAIYSEPDNGPETVDTPTFHGVVRCRSFEEACKTFFKADEYFDRKTNTYYKCRLYPGRLPKDRHPEESLQLSTLTAAVVEDSLQQPGLPKSVRKALELRQAHSKSSVKKYLAMRDRADTDERIRETLLYHGAHTGRWTGVGIQPQNYPRPPMTRAEIESILIPAILRGDVEELEFMAGSISEALSATLRSALVAGPGKELIGADYKSIEAVVLLWLADDQRALSLIRAGKDLYKDMASAIYKVPVDEVTKDQRDVGKRCILGCGYGMGGPKFKTTAKTFGLDLSGKFAKKCVDIYRDRYKSVTRFWRRVNSAAMDCLTFKPGNKATQPRLQYLHKKPWLQITLPSGRKLYYYDPKLTLNRFGQEALSHRHINPVSKKWERTDTYGGKLVENIVQAVARDIMAEAMLRVETKGYKLVMSVHDELVAEIPRGWGSVAEFENELTKPPLWAAGCPIGAEGWRGKRYRK